MTDYVVRIIKQLSLSDVSSGVVSIAKPGRRRNAPVREGEIAETNSALYLGNCANGRQLRKRVADLDPDVISFQFGGFYCYQRKGLPVLRTLMLAGVADRYRIHIMFHETWLEPSLQRSLRRKVVGHAQRWTIKRMLKSLRPERVHTHIVEYQTKLARFGPRVGLMPICGNVPVSDAASGWTQRQLTQCTEGKVDLANAWIFGAFGTLYPDCDFTAFIDSAASVAKTEGRPVIIVTIGATGETGERNLSDAARRHPHHVFVVRLGVQPVERISDFLQYVRWGLTTTAWGRCGKSGTVAAMLDHGLPVLCLQPSPAPAESFGEMSSPLLRLFDPREEAMWKNFNRALPQDSVARVARQFVDEVNPWSHACR